MLTDGHAAKAADGHAGGEPDGEHVAEAAARNPRVPAEPHEQDDHGGDEPAEELKAAFPERNNLPRARHHPAPVGDHVRDSSSNDDGDDQADGQAPDLGLVEAVPAHQVTHDREGGEDAEGDEEAEGRNVIGPTSIVGNVRYGITGDVRC